MRACAQVVCFPDGTKLFVKTDGSRVQENPDGSRIRTQKDGVRISTYPDTGVIIEVFKWINGLLLGPQRRIAMQSDLDKMNWKQLRQTASNFRVNTGEVRAVPLEAALSLPHVEAWLRNYLVRGFWNGAEGLKRRMDGQDAEVVERASALRSEWIAVVERILDSE